MAQKIKDFPIFDFTGGFVTNKSDYQMRNNEVNESRNFDLDEIGRAKRRGGFRVFGTLAGTAIFYAYTYQFATNADGTGAPIPVFLTFSKAANASSFRLVSTSLTADLDDGDVSATVSNNATFPATGTFETDGDIIGFTAKPNVNTFTITEVTIRPGASHKAGKSVNQFLAAVATAIDSRSGIYGTALNNQFYVTGFDSSANTTDGSAFILIGGAAGADTDTPAGLFAVTYRDRAYVAGSSAVDAVGRRNGSPIRVSFSDLGGTQTWGDYLVNFFDVEGSRREMISGLKVFNDRLLIFKLNSFFFYDEVQLKVISEAIGAYNHFVIQEIDGLIYTFCPSGVYVTNGRNVKKISSPIEKYLKAYVPRWDVTRQRVIDNCFAGVFGKKYLLYLDDLEFPSKDKKETTRRDIVLVYDTEAGNWTTYDRSDSGTPTQAFFSFPAYKGGDEWQAREAMFYSVDGKLYRMFNTNEVGGTATLITAGSDIPADQMLENDGVAIQTLLETKFYDLRNPSWWKKIERLRVLVEAGNFNVSYRLDKGTHITDWISLGEFRTPNQRVKLKDNEGFRIAFQVTGHDKTEASIFNGLVVEDITALRRK